MSHISVMHMTRQQYNGTIQPHLPCVPSYAMIMAVAALAGGLGDPEVFFFKQRPLCNSTQLMLCDTDRGKLTSVQVRRG